MSQPTFRGLTLRVVELPMRRPIVAKIGTFEHWPLLLIDVHSEEGVTGHAYLTLFRRDVARYLVPILEDLGARFKGRPVAPQDLFDEAVGANHMLGRTGIVMAAAAGLDMAAWDLAAKAAGLSLAAYLGGTPGPVPAYNTTGLWLGTREGLGEEAATLVEEGGFSAVKLRLGRDTLAEDLSAIAEVRAALGEEAKIMVDFNQGLSLPAAMERLHALDDQGLYWFEEPIQYDDLDGCATLAADLATPIQIGENFWGPRDLHRALQYRACDYVMPDFMRIGGVTGWLRAAAIAAPQGVPVSTHLFPEVGAQVMRVTETAHWLEWCDWSDPILAEPLKIETGRAIASERPGLGIEWDEAAIARYLVD